jgi:hypothetical protein
MWGRDRFVYLLVLNYEFEYIAWQKLRAGEMKCENATKLRLIVRQHQSGIARAKAVQTSWQPHPRQSGCRDLKRLDPNIHTEEGFPHARNIPTDTSKLLITPKYKCISHT